MANPTTGPLGTGGNLIDLSGADVSPYTGLTAVDAQAQFDLVSHTIKPHATGNNARAYKAGTTYGPDCEAWGQVVAKPADTKYFDFMLRIAVSGSTATDFYEMEFDPVAGTDTISFFKKDGGTASQVGTAISKEITVNDWWAFTCEGTTTVSLKAWLWDGLSSWVQQGTTMTDTPTSANLKLAGFFGAEAPVNGGSQIGSIGGGTKVVAPTGASRHLLTLGVG